MCMDDFLGVVFFLGVKVEPIGAVVSCLEPDKPHQWPKKERET